MTIKMVVGGKAVARAGSRAEAGLVPAFIEPYRLLPLSMSMRPVTLVIERTGVKDDSLGNFKQKFFARKFFYSLLNVVCPKMLTRHSSGGDLRSSR